MIRVGLKVLNWFGHVEYMSGELLTQIVYKTDVERRRDRGRPCKSWLDGVKKECSARSLELSDAKVMCMNRQHWRDFVEATNGGVNV